MKRLYWIRLRQLENDILIEMNELLKKTGNISFKTHKEEIEFFSYSTICELEIDSISSESIITSGRNKGKLIRTLVMDGDLTIQDIISLVETLRDITKEKEIS